MVRGDEGLEIAGFRLESEIGRGGMGVVYLAHQSFPERKVALKLLSPELASDPAFRERFVHESNAAASTEHPNIVPVYGAGEADGQLYLAMRYIEGTDLGSLLGREGALPPYRAARICAEIADALEAAHDRGLIHRDVKPGNILLDSRDRAYLTDFGLIRRTQLHTEVTKTGQFMGTVDYCAPEQIKGGEIDGRVDVYSLGCVLFECLTGAPPFRKDTEVATIYAHLEEDVPKASFKHPGISPLHSSAVTKAMAKRPEDRFASAGDMAEALRGQPAMHRPLRRRVGVATVAVVAVLAGALIAYAALGGDDRSPSESPNPSGVPAALPPGSVANVDPQTGAILTKTTGVPISPIFFPDVEWGEGSVWVLSAPDLTQIDPADGSEDRVLPVGGSGTAPVDSLAVGARTVWVGAPPGVIRFNPANGERLRSVRLGSVVETHTREVQVAIGEGHFWAVRSDGELTKIDQLTARKTASVDLGHGASGIGTGFDAVWVVDDLRGTLTQIDANDLGAIEEFATPGAADAIAVGGGAVWIIDSNAGVISPFDTLTGSFDSPIRVGTDPTDIAVGLGSVWVTNHGDGTISQIDPITRDVVGTITSGSPVAALAVDESTSTLWVVVSEARVNI